MTGFRAKDGDRGMAAGDAWRGGRRMRRTPRRFKARLRMARLQHRTITRKICWKDAGSEAMERAAMSAGPDGPAIGLVQTEIAVILHDQRIPGS